MSEQVERLRRTAKFIAESTGAANAEWVYQAADEMERLEKLVAALEAALTGEEGKPSYCRWCDLEHPLHEDAQGFHHAIKGERVACSSAYCGEKND